jgi:hypothetical protein
MEVAAIEAPVMQEPWRPLPLSQVKTAHYRWQPPLPRRQDGVRKPRGMTTGTGFIALGSSGRSDVSERPEEILRADFGA